MTDLALLLIACAYILGAATVVAGRVLYAWWAAKPEREAKAVRRINARCVAKAAHLTPMERKRRLRELERANVVRLTRDGPKGAA